MPPAKPKKAKKPIKSKELIPSGAANPLALYMRELAQFPLLTKEQEQALGRLVRESRDPEAIKKLVQANLRFVVKMAFEYARYGARVMDLIQEGNMGLLRAVHDYDPTKDARLITYAVYWIRSYMQDYLLRNWSLVRIGTTKAQKKLFYNLKKEQERLEREGLSGMMPKQIAHELNVDEADVKLMEERLAGGDVSLSTPISGQRDGNRELTIEHRLQDEALPPSEELSAHEQKELFHRALQEFRHLLNEREQVFLDERLLSEQPRTLEEIGEQYNVSKERARQIEERIKEKLKKFLAEKYPDISVG